jgi:flavorubredoxin
MTFKAIKITDKVYWVGAIDWDVRDFHGYLTQRGTTYNAYLVLADTITLIDTVKAPFYDEMMARIASVIPPEQIQCIVSNHAELDHSGCLGKVMAAVKPDRVFASTNGVRALKAHFHDTLPGEVTAVADGAEVSLGNLTLQFVETRMLHWPDSMFSYLKEEKLLFSNDAFGMHYASTERYADEVSRDILDYEGHKYYANIILPYSSFVLKLLQRLPSLNLDIQMILPDHGPIWRQPQDIAWIISKYVDWAEQKSTQKAIILYDTMWKSTETMARVIADGLSTAGIPVKVLNCRICHRSDVVTELSDARALIVGSPTLNNQIFPALLDTLGYIQGLKPRHKLAAAFGSYGWSGEAPKLLREKLEAMDMTFVGEPLRIQYVPTAADLQACRNLGLQMAAAIKEKNG